MCRGPQASLAELVPLDARVEADMAHKDAQRAMDAMLAALRVSGCAVTHCQPACLPCHWP